MIQSKQMPHNDQRNIEIVAPCRLVYTLIAAPNLHNCSATWLTTRHNFCPPEAGVVSPTNKAMIKGEPLRQRRTCVTTS